MYVASGLANASDDDSLYADNCTLTVHSDFNSSKLQI